MSTMDAPKDVTLWKQTLVEWANKTGLVEKPLKHLDSVNLDEIYEKLKQLQVGQMPPNNLKDFMHENYPAFLPNMDETNQICSTDNVYLFSLFLHFSCQHKSSSSTSNGDKFQKAIVRFFEALKEVGGTFDRASLRHAIRLTVGLPPLSLPSPNSSTSTPDRSNTPREDEHELEVRDLRFKLDSEKQLRADAEIQNEQCEERIARLIAEQNRLVQELAKLKNELSMEADENFSPNKNYRRVEHQRSELQKRIGRKEDQIGDLEREREALLEKQAELVKKLAASDLEAIQLRAVVIDLEAKASELEMAIERRDERINALQADNSELNELISLNRGGKSPMDSSGELLETSVTGAQSSNYFSSGDSSMPPVEENMASAVIDVKLQEEQIENARLREQLATMNGNNMRLAEEIGVLLQRYRVAMNESDNFTLEGHIETLAVSFESLQGDYARAKEEIADIQASIEERVRELTGEKEISAQMALKLDSLTQNHEALQVSYQTAEENVAKGAAECERYKRLVEQLERDHQRQTEENLRAIQEILAERSAQNSVTTMTVQEAIDELRMMLCDTETRAHLLHDMAENTELIQENEKSRLELEERVAMISSLSERLAIVERREEVLKSGLSSLLPTLAAIKSENITLKDNFERFRNEIGELFASLWIEINFKFEEAETIIVGLREQNIFINRQYQLVSGERDTLGIEKETLEVQKISLERTVGENRGRIGELKQKLAKDTVEIESIKEKAEKERQSFATKKTTLEAQIDALDAERTKLNEEIGRNLEQLEVKSRKVEEKQLMAAKGIEERQNLATELQAAWKKKEELEQLLVEAEEVRSTLNGRLESLQETLQATTNGNATLLERIQKLETAKASCDAEKTSLEGQIEKLQAEKANLERQHTDVHLQMDSLRAEMERVAAEASEKSDALESEKTSLQIQLASLTEESQKFIQEEHQTLTARIATLQASLDQLQSTQDDQRRLLSDRDTQIQSLRATLENECINAESALVEQRSRNETLVHETEKLTVELDAALKHKASLDAFNENLKTQNERLQRQLADSERLKAELHTQIEGQKAIERKLADLQTLHEQERAYNKQLAQDFKILQAKLHKQRDMAVQKEREHANDLKALADKLKEEKSADERVVKVVRNEMEGKLETKKEKMILQSFDISSTCPECSTAYPPSAVCPKPVPNATTDIWLRRVARFATNPLIMLVFNVVFFYLALKPHMWSAYTAGYADQQNMDLPPGPDCDKTGLTIAVIILSLVLAIGILSAIWAWRKFKATKKRFFAENLSLKCEISDLKITIKAIESEKNAGLELIQSGVAKMTPDSSPAKP